MDTRKLGEEASLEAARESLIAISYALPDKVLNSVDSGNTEVDANSDKVDDFRSELISISDLQSPDADGNSWNGDV